MSPYCAKVYRFHAKDGLILKAAKMNVFGPSETSLVGPNMVFPPSVTVPILRAKTFEKIINQLSE